MKKVRVDWVDAIGDANIYEMSKVDKMYPKKVSSVGYLYKKDKARLILCATKYEDKDLSDIIIIPRGWVLKITELKVVD